MPTSPGPTLAALTALWERVRADVPELPPILPTISPMARRRDHSPSRWTRTDDGSVSGLVVTADVLAEGPEAVLTAVLHDAAHVLNWVRDVKDITTRGAYHNASFLTAAEEVGLVWPEEAERVQGLGFVNPVLGEAARTRHREDLRALEAAVPDLLPHLALPASSRENRTPDRLTLECRCDPPRKIRISRTVAAQGPIVCGVCGEEFDAS
ncbi:hypothetical protein AB0F77_39515 [Streptomyces sp. NPDC026672]|uniref:hypothetical protein n=1 Tax=Actinomycetes TaxID=1760 RepID=UPI0033F9BD4C